MKKLFVITLFVSMLSCKNSTPFEPRNIAGIEIETLLQDSLLNVRALEITSEYASVYATSKGVIGPIKLNYNSTIGNINEIFYNSVKPYKNDSTELNFRAIAFANESVFSISIGNPSVIVRENKGVNDIVYKENHEKAFYDSMDFWNDQEGIAIGDPTDDCMSIIITRDGGNAWKKLPCDELPKAKDGEAAFAASDTNIAIIGNKTWVATGGKASRILYSPDKGKTWEVFETPIIQGLETTGMYSIDFYDELNGFAIGGDYTKPDDNTANKILTKDGGKTWQLVAQGQEPGYRSCVQYIPNRAGKELVAVGFKGIDYSSDGGYSWKHLSDEGFYTIRFLNDSVAYAAGKGRISKLTFR